MNKPLDPSHLGLTDIQSQAVNWDCGPLLVLGGPGSGRKRVLICRIANLLESAPDQRFRILALTFTSKAAHEMAVRVADLAPGLEARANIRTFHAFCAQVLRQHGVHLGIKPNFVIYSQIEDRRAVLQDALSRDNEQNWAEADSRRLLSLIDYRKSRLVEPDRQNRNVGKMGGLMAEDASRVTRAYRLYEDELRRINALDFNSLVLDTYRLFAYPAFARLYQKAFRYWVIDEFQEANGAQYAVLKRMVGADFRNIFAIADDDQAIFEQNGANVNRIKELVCDFSCSVVQLPTNFRCPPPIVEAANHLVVYNASRASSKQTVMSESASGNPSAVERKQIQCREFSTDEEEVAGIADEIARLDGTARDRTAVLARNRFLLEEVSRALSSRNVPAEITMRRDDFLSPQMRWLVACLKQIVRPLDLRNMAVLFETFNSFGGPLSDWNDLVFRSEAEDITFLKVWTDAAADAGMPDSEVELVGVIAALAEGKIKYADAIEQILDHFGGNESDQDLMDDLRAWRKIWSEIKAAKGLESLDLFLQALRLRPKKTVLAPETVSLATIHGAKGQEFDTVYLIGLAEGILPSWHSLKKSNGTAAIEEERRGCFAAVTCTRRHLILSRAGQYRGLPKPPSRFLEEMGLVGGRGRIADRVNSAVRAIAG